MFEINENEITKRNYENAKMYHENGKRRKYDLFAHKITVIPVSF